MTTGSASDYWYGNKVYQVLKRKVYSITIELRPDRFVGGGGFILHPRYIVPTGEENLVALIAFIKFALQNPLQ